MRSPMNKPYRVTSPYGNRTLGGNPDFHNGIDLVPFDGKHPVDILAVSDGTVVDVRSNVPDSHTGLGVTTMVTGNFVNIRTKEGFTIICRHLKANSVPASIKVNQQIKAGEKIGVMGTTGQSTGVHLHYEIRNPNNQSVNPNTYLDNAVPLPGTPASTPSPVNYDVRVNAGTTLNIRGGAGTNFPVITSLNNSPTLTIIEESNGTGANKWGKLQDGRGWIALDFATKVSPPSTATQIKVGSRGRVNRGAKTYTGGGVASFVYDRTYTVDFLAGNRAVLDSKGLCTPFSVSDLTLV